MIAMSLMNTYDEYRRDQLAHAPVYSTPTRPVRSRMMHVLAMIGLGVGGVAAMDEDEVLGIG